MAAAASSSQCLTGTVQFVNCLDTVVINPILLLLFAAGLLVFIWGLVEYMGGLASDATNREEGRRHMLWGLIGMFIMAAAWAILQLLINTIDPSFLTKIR